jgi:histone-lysine N-methyltransferase SETMAR
MQAAERGLETSPFACQEEIPQNVIHHTVFWDRRGPLLLVFMPRSATINAYSYCGILSLLRAANRWRRPGILVDNARPHVANRTATQLQSFGWEIMEHAPYSPYLAPTDCHVFGPPKMFMEGQRFISDSDAKTAVRECFRTQPTEL